MEEQQSPLQAQIDSRSFLWLALAVAMLIFANGRWIIPITAWLGPVFMVRFLRGQKPFKGLLVGYVVLVVIFFITWKGMVPIPFISFYILTGLLLGIYFLLPYLSDRLLSPRITGFLATLVLPVAWVSVDFVNAQLNPYGHWGLLAYTQNGNLPLLQILSITGIWGVTFIVVWFASVVNWAWEHKFEWHTIRTGSVVYVGILVAVLFLGGARLIIFRPSSDTVRIASVSAPIARASVSDLTEEEPSSHLAGSQCPCRKRERGPLNRTRTHIFAAGKCLSFYGPIYCHTGSIPQGK
jgi:apolipoprotein N-acyltransferase